MVGGRADRYDDGMRVRSLLPCALVAGCGITDFDITQPIPEQTIQGSPIPGPLAALFPIPLNIDIGAQIKAMHTGPIDSVTLASLELDITTPAAADWSFVTQIDVFVASTKSGSSLPKVKLAHATSPGKVRAIHFTLDGNVNLKPYIDEGSQVDGQSSGNAPPDNTSYSGSARFTVHPL